MSFTSVATFATATLFVLLSQDVGYGQNRVQQADPQQYLPLQLIRADAVKAGMRLRAVLGRDADIVTDANSNTIFLRASTGKITKAREILQQMDMPSHLYVIPLKHTVAADTAKTLRMLLQLNTLLGDHRPVHVFPSEQGSSIRIRASQEKAKQVMSILHWLDVQQP